MSIFEKGKKRYVSLFRFVLNCCAKFVVGARNNYQKLIKDYIEHEYEADSDLHTVVNNAKIVFNATSPTSKGHRMVKAVFLESLGVNSATIIGFGSTHSIHLGKRDFSAYNQMANLKREHESHRGNHMLVTQQ